jgi:beta-glucosidase
MQQPDDVGSFLMNARRLLCVFILLAAPAWLRAEEPRATHAAIDPQPRKDEWWQKRHAAFNENVKKTPDTQLIFIGDSITQGWEGAGKEAWAKHYAPRKAVNLGIGGDRTQHVLWRLDNGNLEGIKPKVAVVMIGTNNSGSDSAAHIADGITAIVKKLRTKLPETKVLLLGVFPRGEKTNAQREKLIEVNQTVAKLDDGKSVYYLDIGQNLMNPDGTIFKEVMPDFLHLSPKGYEIWAASIEVKLKELLGEK